jgi:hypothetical protein
MKKSMRWGHCNQCERLFRSVSVRALRCSDCKIERRNKRASKWHKAHRERDVENSRRWQQANPEKHRAHFRKYYHENKEKCKARALSWQKANPEKMKEYRQKRLAAKASRNVSTGDSVVEASV